MVRVRSGGLTTVAVVTLIAVAAAASVPTSSTLTKAWWKISPTKRSGFPSIPEKSASTLSNGTVIPRDFRISPIGTARVKENFGKENAIVLPDR